jgi:hypothetical protein
MLNLAEASSGTVPLGAARHESAIRNVLLARFLLFGAHSRPNRVLSPDRC